MATSFKKRHFQSFCRQAGPAVCSGVSRLRPPCGEGPELPGLELAAGGIDGVDRVAAASAFQPVRSPPLPRARQKGKALFPDIFLHSTMS